MSTMGFFTENVFLRRTLLMLLFLAGLLIRLPHLNETPRNYWTMKQYRSALLARALFFNASTDVPAWRKEAANAARMSYSEPPLLEMLAAKGYGLLGSEQFWCFRILTIGAWLLGGWFLWLLGRRLLTDVAALVSVVVYLFLSFGVIVSRSFQCDALMLCALIGSILGVVHYFERPGVVRCLLCALVSALAIFIKPGSNQFTIFLVYGFLALKQQGGGGALKDGKNWLFAFVALLPAVAYTLWNISSNGYLMFCLSVNFIPSWFLKIYFWRGWAAQLLSMLGPVVLVPGLVGLMLAKDVSRSVLWAWGGGYVLQCFLTTQTTPSHDYWHLQAVPLAALGLGALSSSAWSFMERKWGSARGRVVFGFLLLTYAAFNIGETLRWYAATGPSDFAPMAREIGEAVRHSTRTVYLDYDFGIPLCYFAEMAGMYWPETQVMADAEMAGAGAGLFDQQLSAPERFDLFYRGKKPDYFIVFRAVQEMKLQPGLNDFLFGNYPVLVYSPRYIVFDLRKPLKP